MVTVSKRSNRLETANRELMMPRLDYKRDLEKVLLNLLTVQLFSRFAELLS